MCIIQLHQTTTATTEQVVAGRPRFGPERWRPRRNGADSFGAAEAVNATRGRS